MCVRVCVYVSVFVCMGVCVWVCVYGCVCLLMGGGGVGWKDVAITIGYDIQARK